jgi:hypothetical protein
VKSTKKSGIDSKKGKALGQEGLSRKGRPSRSNRSREKASRAKSESGDPVAKVDRRRAKDRRKKEAERRTKSQGVSPERRKLKRRAPVNRRRQIDPTTCERDYSADEIEFMTALDEYKHKSGRMFPTCSEVLEVVRSLGYVRLAAPGADVSAAAPDETEEK